MVGEIARKGVETDRNLAKKEGDMKPKKPPIETQKQKELFRVELARIIDKHHPLVKLSEVVDLEGLDQVFGRTYYPETGLSATSRSSCLWQTGRGSAPNGWSPFTI